MINIKEFKQNHELDFHVIDKNGNVVKNEDGTSKTIPVTDFVKDKQGNVVSRKKNHTVMHLPRITNHNTFVVGGNEYSLKHQLRTSPRVYTRKRRSEELESSINLAKGANFT